MFQYLHGETNTPTPRAKNNTGRCLASIAAGAHVISKVKWCLAFESTASISNADLSDLVAAAETMITTVLQRQQCSSSSSTCDKLTDRRTMNLLQLSYVKHLTSVTVKSRPLI